MIVYNRDWQNKLYEIEYEKLFLGSCLGVALCKRSKDDNHVTFYILVEDDENWSVKSYSQTSSFWLPDLLSVVQEAEEWLSKNAVKDPSGFGWIFA